PFQLGTYNFNLLWNDWIKVGSSTLSFSKLEKTALPAEAQKVYDTGDIYKVVFECAVDFPVLHTIASGGVFTSYIKIKEHDANPLMSVAEARLLGRTSNITTIYDYNNHRIKVNNKEYSIAPEKMQKVRDPVSHVIHLLFRPRLYSGTHFCGYYNDENGILECLNVDYRFKDDKLVGFAEIPAKTYVLDTQVTLELPYSFNVKKQLFVPSLKERVAMSHKLFGKIVFEFSKFYINKHLE
ncbi:hypothetical protein HY485_00640, partial [Candidatus Woesearchaeota archaeon]|nr:hypothetical protein [Candidatus Woesearchaeota archaeon]